MSLMDMVAAAQTNMVEKQGGHQTMRLQIPSYLVRERRRIVAMPVLSNVCSGQQALVCRLLRRVCEALNSRQ